METKMTSIRDVFEKRPEVFAPLMEYTERMMRSSGALSQCERELIASMTSLKNGCEFCYESHMAVCSTLGGLGYAEKALIQGMNGTNPRYEAFLAIAKAGCELQPVPARATLVLSDEEILDAVTVVASFNLFNRLVEMHSIPRAPDELNQVVGKVLAHEGYTRKPV